MASKLGLDTKLKYFISQDSLGHMEKSTNSKDLSYNIIFTEVEIQYVLYKVQTEIF